MLIWVHGDSTAQTGGWPSVLDFLLSNDTVAGFAVGNSYLQESPAAPMNPINGSVLDRLRASDLSGVDKLIIKAGVNDIHQAEIVGVDPLPQMIAAVQEIKALGVPVVFMMVDPLDAWPSWNTQKEAYRVAYNNYLVTSGCDYIDTSLVLDLNNDNAMDDTLTSDGLHPDTPLAYTLLADQVARHCSLSLIPIYCR